jgi:hypothetical protein
MSIGTRTGFKRAQPFVGQAYGMRYNLLQLSHKTIHLSGTSPTGSVHVQRIAHNDNVYSPLRDNPYQPSNGVVLTLEGEKRSHGNRNLEIVVTTAQSDLLGPVVDPQERRH